MSIPWQRSTVTGASQPSYVHPSVVGGWTIGVFRDGRGNLTAKLWRVTGRHGSERHVRAEFDSVADAEAWCDRMYALLCGTRTTNGD